MLQPLWKTVWQLLKNKQTNQPCSYYKQFNNCTPKHLSQIREDLDTKSFTWMFIATLCIISENGKESRCPSTVGQLVLCYIHTMEYLLLRNKKEWSIDAFPNVSPENSVQLLSRVWLLATPWTTACQVSLSITNSRSLPKPMSIELVMPSSHLILCRPLLLLPSIFPSIRVFQMSQLFTSCGQSIGVSAPASVLPMNSQDWFPLGWTGWISLQSKRLSRVFSNTTVQKHQFSVLSFLHSPTLTSIHDQWKNHSLD